MNALGDALKNNKNIWRLRVTGSTINSDSDVGVLVSNLIYCRRLKELDLSNNQISDYGVLRDIITRFISLDKLDLSGNLLDDERIGGDLTENCVMKEFYINENPLGLHSAMKILKSISVNSLRSLGIMGEAFGKEEVKNIAVLLSAALNSSSIEMLSVNLSNSDQEARNTLYTGLLSNNSLVQFDCLFSDHRIEQCLSANRFLTNGDRNIPSELQGIVKFKVATKRGKHLSLIRELDELESVESHMDNELYVNSGQDERSVSLISPFFETPRNQQTTENSLGSINFDSPRINLAQNAPKDLHVLVDSLLIDLNRFKKEYSEQFNILSEKVKNAENALFSMESAKVLQGKLNGIRNNVQRNQQSCQKLTKLSTSMKINAISTHSKAQNTWKNIGKQLEELKHNINTHSYASLLQEHTALDERTTDIPLKINQLYTKLEHLQDRYSDTDYLQISSNSQDLSLKSKSLTSQVSSLTKRQREHITEYKEHISNVFGEKLLKLECRIWEGLENRPNIKMRINELDRKLAEYETRTNHYIAALLPLDDEALKLQTVIEGIQQIKETIEHSENSPTIESIIDSGQVEPSEELRSALTVKGYSVINGKLVKD